MILRQVMEYKEIKPCTALQPYIHSFWELKGDELDKQWERNFPDGCAGFVMNLSDTCLTDNGTVSMEFGKTYAVGAMRSFKKSYINSDLIDELIISIVPVLVGNGTRLFKDGRPEQQLEFVTAKTFDTGLIQLQYRRMR